MPQPLFQSHALRLALPLAAQVSRFHCDAYVQRVLGTAMNHAAQGRHVAIVAANGQRDVVFARRTPAALVVGGVKVAPARIRGKVGEVGNVGRHPGVGRVAAHQPGHARRRLGEQVAAHVAGGQAQGAQTGNHDVGKVLAHAFALGQGLQRGRADLGAFGFVGEVGVDTPHQVPRGLQQRRACGEA